MPKFTKEIFEKQLLDIVRRPKVKPARGLTLQKLLDQAKVKRGELPKV